MKKWKILLAVLLVAIIVCAVVIFANLETPQETPQDTTADKTATVTFYNGDKVYETATVEIGAKLTLPKAPKAEKGKGLIGWSTIDGDVEEIIDPATFVVNADIKLYTVWADVYTVTINADNGQPFDVREVFAGTIIEKPADPVKEGFKFVEWRDALQETAFDFSQPIYADVIIKAMYGDGAPNRVSDTKWDFSTGVHGSWIGAQGGWNYQINGLPAKDMVYQTTEDGYAAWGFTLTDSLDNIPVVDGNNTAGLGMKYIYNEGISVSASKAKLVVIYLKPKYYPIDMATSPNDQFRISVLTSNGGMIYGYGSGSEDWSLRTDAGSKNLIQVDHMEDGWIRVQFKIHKLKVWSEDAVIKGMAISFVQRKATPVMDVISVKSIELLDQEEFIDPHEIEYVTKNEWDMTKEEDSTDWFGVMSAGVDTNSVKTTIDANGTQYIYGNTNKWRGMVLNTAKIDISKCSGIFSATIDISGMQPTNYRLYILTDKGGDLYKNSGRDDVSCYYAVTSATELAEGWTVTPNGDGTITVYYDLTKLEYWNTGTELQGLSFVTVDGTTNGTVIYKSVSLVDAVNTHNCETDGHLMKDATCTKPKTCSVCGVTQGEAKGHSFTDGICSVCGVPEFVQNKWDMSYEQDAANWSGYHAKKKNEALTVTVTEAGLKVSYASPGNGWKGLVLENTALDISELTGKLTFTYSSDMAITSYRIHIVTDLGGNLTANGTADCYVAAKIADITAGSLEAWTQTINADGSVTVTFDLSTMGYFKNGTELKGLTIVTVTENNTTGTVTYKTIELEATGGAHDCQAEGHIWRDATCTKPKTCSVCGATEGKPAEHNWSDATCTKPKTCSVCGVTQGEAKGHSFTDGICSVCGVPEFVQNKWDMSYEQDAANWSGYHSKKKNEALTVTVTEAGLKVSYASPGNGWKGLVLENTALDISELTGKLTFTYSSDMAITSYRIHIVTDLGGNLTANGTADCYVAAKIADITAGSLEAWTQTINADGTVTVTFDLSTMGYFKNGTELKGLTIVTVTENNTTGTVTYKTIELEATGGAHDCQAEGHIWRDATCIKPKTCSACGATEGEPLGHTWLDATCTKPKTCSACGATEGEPLEHTWVDATCTKPKTCSACGATEGEPGSHADVNGDHKCDLCETNLCTDHNWIDATCLTPKVCSVCGVTQGEAKGHSFTDGICSVCGVREFALNKWDLSNGNDAADWSGYHAKKKNEALTVTVTEAGLAVAYDSPGNGWKGLVLEDTALDISKLTGKLTFTYSSDMEITNYRIHILTDLGGNLTANGTADCYVDVSIADITAGKLDAWTQTNNADGSVTVTFDLSTLKYFADGTELKGLTIVTVTKNKVTGTVIYKSIELEVDAGAHDCQTDGHVWRAATCTKPRTCSICGATEGEPLGHNWIDATCTTPKTCSACGAIEGESLGHNWSDATCTNPRTCSACGATEGEPLGHTWSDATCMNPKTCSVCGETEGELGGHADANGDYKCDVCGTNLCTDHTWSDATCTKPKTCSVCGAVEGDPVDHTWSDATCIKLKTCSVCGATEGELGGHVDTDKDHVCDVCAGHLVVWYMNNAEDAADWSGYHSKKKNEALTTTVTEAGLAVAYATPGNGWKGLVLEDTAIDISKLTGKLTFTYSSDMDITSYRIHILTDLGGNLTANGTADCYVAAAIADITAGSLEAWTQTNNADGSVTVTFDLSTLKYFTDGTELKGLTIVTVTANKVIGTVTYKSIELETISEEHDCQVDGHTWFDATCIKPKTCSICGATEGEPLGHTWVDATCTNPRTCSVCGETEGEPLGHNWSDATCTKPKTCSVCGETEGEPLGHTWVDATCTKPKTCSVCGTTEGELGNHTDANGDYKCDICEANLCTDHTWNDATCIKPKTCSVCGATEGEPLGHSWSDATCTNPKTCSVCGETEGEPLGHNWSDATCTNPRTCSVCGATEGDPLGHNWSDATCTNPRTCSVCGATEGDPLGHTWVDATCATPKTCSVCGATEGEPLGHTWVDATCAKPKTCSVCGAIEGDRLAHTDADNDLVCDVCTDNMAIWVMNNAADAADWSGYHSKIKNEALTTTVTEAGLEVAYASPGNGWKALVLENTALKISKLTGKLTFTYSSDMAITSYRIHILTDLGGNLTANGTADCYVAAKIADITAGSLEAWTQTTNADGSVTVTFDLSTLKYFADGTELRGLTIVTVTANKVTGTVTYKSIELEAEEHDCQVDGHNWSDATCTTPKTCSVCGATEGEALGHEWVENACIKSCSRCGIKEGTSVAHTYENGVCTVCGASAWDTNSDGILEILAIGNSFSTDALEYAWQIARDLGIEKVVVANIRIGGCTLNTHITNANGDLASYTYYHNDNGTWVSTENYKLSTALESRSWDYVSLQQASGESGMESTYNEDLTDLVAYIKARSNAKLVWHMTWAYQQNSDHAAFPTYNSDQMTMYNAIVTAVQNKIVTNSDFALIVPNGTAVQNARTSLVGDTLTRDGYHMSKDYGRYLTGLMFIKTVTGLDISEIAYVPDGVSKQYRDIAVESVNNAYANPFEVTQSAYVGADLSKGYILLQPELYQGAYWNPTHESNYNTLITGNSISNQFYATIRFTREDLPVGSVIVLTDGWQYRPDGWITDELQTGTREKNTTAPYIEITEEWWGEYTIRSFNISKVDGSSLAEGTEEEVRAAFKIYVPEESHSHTYENGVCTLCGGEMPKTSWDMSDEADAADWSGYHAKKKNEALTTTVTEAGLAVAYDSPGNGWKGLVLEDTAIDISKLTGKLTFTYSSDMAITSYRIHILTDLGGNLTANGTADCYVAAKIADITAGSLDAWTQTTNADGSVTVTFDLATMGYFSNGKKLKGLTIVTVTANKVTGTVTYKSIEIR